VIQTSDLGVSFSQLNEDFIKQKPLLLFDLRSKDVFENSHIKGSVHAVCDVHAKENIMPKIPKNSKIVLIS
jgi:rhodanese-related sulfurtransferase